MTAKNRAIKTGHGEESENITIEFVSTSHYADKIYQPGEKLTLDRASAKELLAHGKSVCVVYMD